MGGPGSGRRVIPKGEPAQNAIDHNTAPVTMSIEHVRPFAGAEFVAWVSSVTPNRAGVRINMSVPYDQRESVKTLWDAIGLPVMIHMTEWEEYRKAKDEMDAQESEGLDGFSSS